MAETAKRRGVNGCIEYPFAAPKAGKWLTGGGGYGAYKNKAVHRLVCEMAHGPAPKDKQFALHSCHNRRCCNPDHLRWGDARDNHNDAVAAGRHVTQGFEYPEPREEAKAAVGHWLSPDQTARLAALEEETFKSFNISR